MRLRSVHGALAIGLGMSLLGWPGAARVSAQSVPVATSTTTSSDTGLNGFSPFGSTNPLMNPYLNPYLNPGMNPYFNPMLSQAAQTPGHAALYFYAAQSMTGGLGSGRLSGVRPGPADSSAHRSGRVAATTKETPHTSNTPGAGASRYFNRGFASAATPSHYYNRQSRQIPPRGR